MRFGWTVGLYVIGLVFTTSAFARGLCVSSFQAKLYTEPTRSAKVSWVVGRYTPLVEIDQKGSWRKVKDIDGQSHWISNKDITSRFRCVAVRSKVTTVRTGPSLKNSPAALRTVDKYTSFRRLEPDNEPDGWYHVEDESGERYWVSASHVWRPVTVSQIGF